MNRTIQRVILATVTLGVAGAAFAQVKPEDEIRYRQSVMNVIGRNFGGVLGAMAKGERPYDQATAVKAATLVDMLSGLPANSFGPGTEKGAPTKADPKIWKDQAKFKAAYDKMVAEVAKLPAAAKDPAALKAQVAETGKACKACHDDFRLKEFRS
jgi:cytochrome c556